MIFSYRVFGLLMICLIFVFCATANALADQTSVSVEQGQLIIIPIPAEGDLAETAKLASVTNLNPDAGKVAPANDGKAVSYLAKKNYVGTDMIKYTITDPAAGQNYEGEISISVESPLRIVTIDPVRVGGVLGIILVLAIVLEIGLATLFNWKYFQERLLGKGLRTPIAIAVSAFFVIFYKLDAVCDLLGAFTGGPQSSFGKTIPGYIITSFIVAGGSGTVNQLFEKLGIRSPIQQPAKIIVEFNRQNVPSTALINVSIDGQLQSSTGGDRFPETGQCSLSVGSHEIEIEARDATGVAKKVKQAINVAAGAEVKVTMTI
ncbi:MAG: hypothetical protein JWR80_9616 [Bradyrhizobium sp.]|nr:hypothetical protein [Bradyrhizobium sp.]